MCVDPKLLFISPVRFKDRVLLLLLLVVVSGFSNKT